MLRGDGALAIGRLDGGCTGRVATLAEAKPFDFASNHFATPPASCGALARMGRPVKVVKVHSTYVIGVSSLRA